MLIEVTARAVILGPANRLLAIYFPPADIYYTPGGRLEGAETPLAALVRELSEELPNFDFRISEYLGLIEHRWSSKGTARSGRHHFYLVQADNLTPSLTPPPAEDGLSYEWIDLKTNRKLTPQALTRLLLTGPVQGKTWNEIDDDIR